MKTFSIGLAKKRQDVRGGRALSAEEVELVRRSSTIPSRVKARTPRFVLKFNLYASLVRQQNGRHSSTGRTSKMTTSCWVYIRCYKKYIE